MQDNFKALPLVKDYIRVNMPNGGYAMVARRLSNAKLKFDNKEVLREVIQLKKDNNIKVIYECLIYMQENKIALDENCIEFIKLGAQKKEGL